MLSPHLLFSLKSYYCFFIPVMWVLCAIEFTYSTFPRLSGPVGTYSTPHVHSVPCFHASWFHLPCLLMFLLLTAQSINQSRIGSTAAFVQSSSENTLQSNECSSAGMFYYYHARVHDWFSFFFFPWAIPNFLTTSFKGSCSNYQLGL